MGVPSCPWEEKGGREAMGGLWAPHGALLCGVVWGSCSLLLSLLPAHASSPAEAPGKKIAERFFFTDDEMNKWSHVFLFALACHFIHFGLFNNF